MPASPWVHVYVWMCVYAKRFYLYFFSTHIDYHVFSLLFSFRSLIAIIRKICQSHEKSLEILSSHYNWIFSSVTTRINNNCYICISIKSFSGPWKSMCCIIYFVHQASLFNIAQKCILFLAETQWEDRFYKVYSQMAVDIYKKRTTSSSLN